MKEEEEEKRIASQINKKEMRTITAATVIERKIERT